MTERWVNQWDPTDTGKDVDEDYLGKFGQDTDPEPVKDCVADDPTVGEEQYNQNTDPDDEFEHGRDTDEYTINQSIPSHSGVRTLWPGDDPNAFKQGGLRYKNQVGLPTKRGKAETNYRIEDDDDYRYVETIVSKLFPSKKERFVENIVYLILDDPYFNSSWNRNHQGITGASVGYSGAIMNDDTPVERISEVIGIEPLFDSKEDIEKAINYAERRIDDRDIDVTQY